MIRVVDSHLSNVALAVFAKSAFDEQPSGVSGLDALSEMALDLYSFDADDDLKAVYEAAYDAAAFFRQKLSLEGVKLEDAK